MNRDTLAQILDLARWAPSGDNTQPWRFEIVGEDQVAIHGFDTRKHVVYDFNGRPSQIAHGALIETLRIAATGFNRVIDWTIRAGSPEDAPVYDVTFRNMPDLEPDPLFPYIEQRVVQRRPMRTQPLSSLQRRSLEKAVGKDYSLRFFEGAIERLKVAKLLWDSADIRLRSPEAYLVHREIIEWGERYSKDRLPEEAVGVDPVTAKLMKWVMGSWGRVQFFNRYLLGTIAPRIQLDFIPGFSCAAHILMQPRTAPTGLMDYVQAGIALQRLWLTATANDLYLQPEMTPVIFRWYARAEQKISIVEALNQKANELTEAFESLACAKKDDSFVFFCRVGVSGMPRSRSIRKDLGDLWVG